MSAQFIFQFQPRGRFGQLETASWCSTARYKMMRQFVSRGLRLFKSFIMWLTGQPELNARVTEIERLLSRLLDKQNEALLNLEKIHRRLSDLSTQQLDNETIMHGLAHKQAEAGATSYHVSEKLDIVLTLLTQQQPLSEQAITGAMAREIDRFDGYLVYHMGETRADIDRLSSKLLGKVAGKDPPMDESH